MDDERNDPHKTADAYESPTVEDVDTGLEPVVTAALAVAS